MTGPDPFSEASRREAHLALGYANAVKAPTRARAAERDPAWRARAACASAVPADFYGETGAAGQARALALCADCPVKAQCCEYAEALGDVYGIWGGLRPDQRSDARRNVLRERKRIANERRSTDRQKRAAS